MPTAKSTVAIKRIKRPRVPTTAGGFTSDFHKRRVLQAKSLIREPPAKKNITTGFSVLPENEPREEFRGWPPRHSRNNPHSNLAVGCPLPTISLGEAFWSNKAKAVVWRQNYSVW